MGEQLNEKKESKIYKLSAKAKSLSLECEVKKDSVLLFVSANKKVLKRSEANHGKNEITINGKSVDVLLRSDEASTLLEENKFVLWISENGNYKKLVEGKFK